MGVTSQNLKKSSKILFQLSGSIACYKACNLISSLVGLGHEVQTVSTANALRFVGAATLEGLTGRPAFSDSFQENHMMDHISLVKWCDIALLCPASATTINKMAHGIGDNLVTNLFLAFDFKKPYLIAPAMNTLMLSHPATQSSLEKLKSWGVTVLSTSSGRLACGDIGSGKLLEPDEILKYLFQKPSSDLKILITSGGTREFIDQVRFISNISTGSTGAALADYFSSKGDQITYLCGEGSIKPSKVFKEIHFTHFKDLRDKLRHELDENHYDAIIHLAAVSDYSIQKIESEKNTSLHSLGIGKIDSYHNEIYLTLSKNPKILNEIRSFSRNKDIVIVGFKLTAKTSDQLIYQKIQEMMKYSDLIVHNDLEDISGEKHKAHIYLGHGSQIETKTKFELAQKLREKILERKILFDRPELTI